MLVNIFRLTPTKSEVLDWFSENGSKVNFLFGDGYFLKSTTKTFNVDKCKFNKYSWRFEDNGENTNVKKCTLNENARCEGS